MARARLSWEAGRVRLTYYAECLDEYCSERELPFVVGVLGDFVGNPEEALPKFRDRKFIEIEPDTFNQVIAAMKPRLVYAVENKLSEEGRQLEVELKFKSIEDFEPDQIVQQVEPLRILVEARKLFFFFDEDHRKEQAPEMIGEFGHQVTSGELTMSKKMIEAINHGIAEIDVLISLQLNEIMHQEAFQKLEASWRGLYYLVHQSQPGQYLKIKVLSVSKKDLLKDFERNIEFDQSALFKIVYEDIYGTFGEDPFGMLIGDYEFSNHPQDMNLLDYLSQVAACSHAPLISAASPGLFGWDDFAEMYEISNVSKIFDQVEYTKWRSFRESEDSRSVGLCLPHILLREPDSQDSEGLFNFQESVVPKTLLWGNAAYAFGACVAKAYRESSWFGMMNGPESDGLVEGLSGYEIKGLNHSIDILIEARREAELSALGFIPLIQNLTRNETSFFGAQSCYKAKLYDSDAANLNARATSRLPHIFALSRFAHYLKVIVRDRPRSFADKEELQQELRGWLDQYTHYDATRSRYPLKQARIDVVELPNKPGELRGVAYLSPVYQIDELSVGQRIVFDIPKNLGSSVKSQPPSIQLEKISKRLFVSQLSDEFLRENKKFYLAIRSSLPENKFVENVHHLLKISSRKTIGKVLHFAAPGITFERVLPPNLSLPEASFHYFLLWAPPILYWKLVEEEKQIAVNAAPDLEVLEIKLLGDQFGELPPTLDAGDPADYIHLNLVDEPNLTLRDAGSSLHSYRFFWKQTFDTQRLFRVNIEPDQTGNIVVKTYRSGFRGGQLFVNWTQNDTFQLSSEEVAWWFEVIENCGFWEMERGSRTGRERDGTSWTIEGLKYGNYKELIRWLPQEPDILKLGAAFHKLGHFESVEITSELQRIVDLASKQENSINQEFDQGEDTGQKLFSNDPVKENEAIDR